MDQFLLFALGGLLALLVVLPAIRGMARLWHEGYNLTPVALQDKPPASQPWAPYVSERPGVPNPRVISHSQTMERDFGENEPTFGPGAMVYLDANGNFTTRPQGNRLAGVAAGVAVSRGLVAVGSFELEQVWPADLGPLPHTGDLVGAPFMPDGVQGRVTRVRSSDGIFYVAYVPTPLLSPSAVETEQLLARRSLQGGVGAEGAPGMPGDVGVSVYASGGSGGDGAMFFFRDALIDALGSPRAEPTPPEPKPDEGVSVERPKRTLARKPL